MADAMTVAPWYLDSILEATRKRSPEGNLIRVGFVEQMFFIAQFIMSRLCTFEEDEKEEALNSDAFDVLCSLIVGRIEWLNTIRNYLVNKSVKFYVRWVAIQLGYEYEKEAHINLLTAAEEIEKEPPFSFEVSTHVSLQQSNHIAVPTASITTVSPIEGADSSLYCDLHVD